MGFVEGMSVVGGTGEVAAWDRFLTERDRQHLAMRPWRAHQQLGGSPALVLVDLYRAVFGDHPQPLLEALPRWRSTCGLEAWDSLDRGRHLLSAAREAGVPVIHTTGSTLLARRSEPDVVDDEDAAADRRRGYALMPELEPVAGELVIEKTAPSAFFGTPLITYLVRSGVDTLVVIGGSTSGCVRATVVDARSHGLSVMLVEDGVFDRHELAHAANLFDMHQKYARLASTTEALAYLGDAPAEARSPGQGRERVVRRTRFPQRADGG